MSPWGWLSIGFCCTLAAAGCALAGLVLRPFADLRERGRRFAYESLVCWVLSLPLYWYAAPGTNDPFRLYVVGLTPLPLGLVAVVVYPRRQASTRGFEVVQPPDGGPGAV